MIELWPGAKARAMDSPTSAKGLQGDSHVGPCGSHQAMDLYIRLNKIPEALIPKLAMTDFPWKALTAAQI